MIETTIQLSDKDVWVEREYIEKYQISSYTTHIVKVSETLFNICFRYYGSSSNWMDIANINNIDNPLELKPGSKIIIPI